MENYSYILIAGSRDFEDLDVFATVFNKMAELLPQSVLASRNIVIVEGGARGVDTMAREFAKGNGLLFKEFKPEWNKYGRAAGPKRNDTMTEFVAEHNGRALFFWDGESKGTKQCIMSARKRGLPMQVWNTAEGRLMSEREMPA